MDFVFDILLPPYLARINLEKAESAYYLYQNWSKSRLPPKKPMWTDRHKIPGHVWTDRHKIPGHVWTDRHKNPGHLGHRDTENADKKKWVKERKKEEEEK